MHHLLGSLERVESRKDGPRKNRKVDSETANVRAGRDVDGWMDMWLLPAMIDEYGSDKVGIVLQEYRSG